MRVMKCSVELGGQPTKINMYVIMLGSYDILISMDYLEEHWSIINCKHNIISYITKGGARQQIQGIESPITLRHTSIK